MNYLPSIMPTAIKHLFAAALQKSALTWNTPYCFRPSPYSFESLNWLYFEDIFRVFFAFKITMGITPK